MPAVFSGPLLADESACRLIFLTVSVFQVEGCRNSYRDHKEDDRSRPACVAVPAAQEADVVHVILVVPLESGLVAVGRLAVRPMTAVMSPPRHAACAGMFPWGLRMPRSPGILRGAIDILVSPAGTRP